LGQASPLKVDVQELSVKPLNGPTMQVFIDRASRRERLLRLLRSFEEPSNDKDASRLELAAVNDYRL
jgi:hypothetical protein